MPELWPQILNSEDLDVTSESDVESSLKSTMSAFSQMVDPKQLESFSRSFTLNNGVERTISNVRCNIEGACR